MNSKGAAHTPYQRTLAQSARSGARPHYIGLAGPYDFLPLKDPDFIDMFGTTHKAQLRSQPVHFVDGDEPPMLLLQGAADTTVEPRNARALATAMDRAGEPAATRLYPGIGHMAILLSMARPFRNKAPVLDDALTFIHQHADTEAAIPR